MAVPLTTVLAVAVVRGMAHHRMGATTLLTVSQLPPIQALVVAAVLVAIMEVNLPVLAAVVVQVSSLSVI